MIGIAVAGLVGFLLIGIALRKQEKKEIKRFKQNLYSL
jgi:hypothetical protein